MVGLALGSACTVSTLICLPDAVGIIPTVPDLLHWTVRLLGLWLSAFTLWSLSCLALLHLARFACGGIILYERGIKLWRFGKLIAWSDVSAAVVEKQPLFSFAFGLTSVARRLTLYEEKVANPAQSLGNWQRMMAASRLMPQSIPSFHFAEDEFRSLFAHICKMSFGFVPHSLDCCVFSPDAAAVLRATSKRASLMRVVLSLIIACGLVTFLGRRAAINYCYNAGSQYFTKMDYASAARQYRLATKIDPTFAQAWDQLARSELRQGDLGPAEQHWRRALQMKPDLVESKVGLSCLYIYRGDLQAARVLLAQCACLAPHNSAVYLTQAALYLKLGDYRQVHSLLAVVERESAANASALVAAARIYWQLKEYEQSYLLAGKALRLDPSCSDAVALLRLCKLSASIKRQDR